MDEVLLLLELLCFKVDPTEVSRCTKCVHECVLDEGVKQTNWCLEDYMEMKDVEDYWR